ncbi:hypothetical protein ACFJIX_29210 [Roseateles sp. UC29_93]|uniref:hypothetical protein n=1 Tax=Roseateles sp. UC29_93 TaxID=3350177 RepID=UPI003672004A
MLAWPFFLHTPADFAPGAAAAVSERARCFVEAAFRRIEAQRLDDLVQSYRRSGGLIEANALALHLRERCDQPISRLARWIVGRDIVVVAGHGALLVPLFQFDADTGEVLVVVRQVLDELNGAFDDREVADWFVQPNCWIDDHWPLDLLRSDPAAVVEAARADRFIARG